MINKIKRFIENNITLKRYFWLLNIFGKKQSLGFKGISAEVFFKLLSSHDISFVQIGANDGVKNDPINEFILKNNWKGILVEPMPLFYEKLLKNYSNQINLKFENVGIADKSGDLDFYYLPAKFNEPDWIQQIGTFSLDSIKLNLEGFDHLLSEITSKKIKVITIDELVKKHSVTNLDLVVIDAEGFEYKILSNINKLGFLPTYIFFEWGSMTKEDFNNCVKLLASSGYKLFQSGGDILAMNDK